MDYFWAVVKAACFLFGHPRAYQGLDTRQCLYCQQTQELVTIRGKLKWVRRE